MTTDRLKSLIDSLPTSNLDAVILNPGPTLTHLTGVKIRQSGTMPFEKRLRLSVWMGSALESSRANCVCSISVMSKRVRPKRNTRMRAKCFPACA